MNSLVKAIQAFTLMCRKLLSASTPNPILQSHLHIFKDLLQEHLAAWHQNLDSFPIAVVTNYWKPDGCNSRNVFLSTVENRRPNLVSLGCDRDVARATLPPDALGDNLLHASRWPFRPVDALLQSSLQFSRCLLLSVSYFVCIQSPSAFLL